MDRDMFDTMTIVKTLGALFGALLIFLLGGWFASVIYSERSGHGGAHVQGYEIATGDEGAAAEEETGPTFEELMASADAGAGERVFRKCTACHSADAGVNMTGPSLHAVVDRPIGSIDGFGYSGALSAIGDSWTPEHLFAFLEKPSTAAPGTTMGFAGLSKEQDRVNLIAYLQTLN